MMKRWVIGTVALCGLVAAEVRADNAALLAKGAALFEQGNHRAALRALFVVFLLVKTLWAVLAYAALALLFHFRGEAGERRTEDDLGSPELATRNRRIAELEKRFRDLEQG